MKEIIPCPQCARKLELADIHVGKPVQCPSCGKTFEGRRVAATLSRPTIISAMPPLPPVPVPESRNELPADRGSARVSLASHRGSMILTFGVLSLLPCILTSVLFGALAWTMGENDLRAMRTGSMHSDGEGLTAAGRTMGIVGLLLWSTVWFFGCLALIR